MNVAWAGVSTTRRAALVCWAALWAVAGCAPTPLLHLPPAPAARRPARQPWLQAALGPFTAERPEDASHAFAVRDYLAERLPSLTPAAPGGATAASAAQPRPAPAAPYVIDGAVSLRRVADPANPAPADRILVRGELNLSLRQPPGAAAVQSFIAARTAGDQSPQAIQAALRQAADVFLDWLAGPAAPEPVKMAAGHSRFDRRGRRLAAQGRWEEALACFRQAADARPDDHAALFNAGLTCEALGRYHESQVFYERALRQSDRGEYRRARGRVQGILEPR